MLSWMAIYARHPKLTRAAGATQNRCWLSLCSKHSTPSMQAGLTGRIYADTPVAKAIQNLLVVGG
jgi:hypothetical protein